MKIKIIMTRQEYQEYLDECIKQGVHRMADVDLMLKELSYPDGDSIYPDEAEIVIED